MTRDPRGAFALFLTLMAGVPVLGCSSEDAKLPAQPAGGSAAAEVPVSSALAGARVPLDVQSAAQRAQLAYRASDAGHEAAAPTYAVKVRNGRVSITPFHHPEARSRSLQATPEPRWEGTALALETLSVKRGTARLDSARAVAKLGSDGELQLSRGEVTEIWRNSENGAEQSWRFAALPRGSGDLLVRVSAEGQKFRGETPSGLHFVGPKHALGMRYGHGTWIDAAGNRTAVPARWTGSAIELRVGSDVLERAAYPALLDPTIGPELDTDEPVTGPAAHWSQFPRVATNSDGVSLVTWQVNTDIYGVRLGADGALVGDAFPISEWRSNQSDASVSAMGTDWFVVWSDTRAGSSDSDLYGARVAADGNVLDPDGIAIATGAGQTYYTALSNDGTNWLAVWTDTRTASEDIYGARIDASGSVLDPAGIVISSAGDILRSASVAHNGTDFLVAWEDARNGVGNYDIYGARVDAGGVVLDAGGIPICTQGSAQAGAFVSSDGTNWLVTWIDLRNGAGNFDIYGARVGANGAVLDGGGIAISTAAGNQGGGVSAYDGTSYVVAWSDPRNSLSEVYGSRVGSDGSVTTPAGVNLLGVTDAVMPALSFNGTNWVVTWMAYLDDIYQAFGTRLDPALAPLDSPTVLSVAPNTQLNPAAAFDGTNWLVVWADSRNGLADIYGARFDSNGTLLDEPAIAITQTPDFEMTPAVDHDGTNWLVAWTRYSAGNLDVFGARVDATGSVLDPAGIEISAAANHQQTPAISHDGDNWLVVWDDSRNPGGGGFPPMPNNDIYGARIAPDGVVLDTTGIAISTETSYQVQPKVIHDGSNWLAVWQDARGGGYRIYGARIDADGVVLDATGFRVSNAESSQLSATLASDGTNTLIAWLDNRNTDMDVYGARVATDGTLVDTTDLELSTSDAQQSAPSLAYSGVGWVLAWNDDRDGYEAADLFATDIDELGVAANPDGVLVSDAVYQELQVHASPGPIGSVLLSYVTTSGANIRVKARLASVCTPIDTDDTTCDGIDDDCSGGVDDDFVVTPTTCGTGGCQTTGSSTCASGNIVDTCTPDPTDTDTDLVPNCADACPLVPANTSNGCPRKKPAQGGSSNAGGEAGDSGLPPGAGGTTSSTGGRSASGGTIGSGGDAGGDSSVPGSDGGAPEAGEGGQGVVTPPLGGAGGNPDIDGDAGDANAGAGTPPEETEEDDDSGCGCRVGVKGSAHGSAWLLAGALLVFTARRRRVRGAP
jgi:MYXO-CTERM domain-containing protein